MADENRKALNLDDLDAVSGGNSGDIPGEKCPYCDFRRPLDRYWEITEHMKTCHPNNNSQTIPSIPIIQFRQG